MNFILASGGKLEPHRPPRRLRPSRVERFRQQKTLHVFEHYPCLVNDAVNLQTWLSSSDGWRRPALVPAMIRRAGESLADGNGGESCLKAA